MCQLLDSVSSRQWAAKEADERQANNSGLRWVNSAKVRSGGVARGLYCQGVIGCIRREGENCKAASAAYLCTSGLGGSGFASGALTCLISCCVARLHGQTGVEHQPMGIKTAGAAAVASRGGALQHATPASCPANQHAPGCTAAMHSTYSATAPCSSSHVRMCRMLRRSIADDCLMSLLINIATAPTPTAQAAGTGGSARWGEWRQRRRRRKEAPPSRPKSLPSALAALLTDCEDEVGDGHAAGRCCRQEWGLGREGGPVAAPVRLCWVPGACPCVLQSIGGPGLSAGGLPRPSMARVACALARLKAARRACPPPLTCPSWRGGVGNSFAMVR